METDFLLSGLENLGRDLEGDLKYDRITRIIYSTDASVYREVPLAVSWPRNTSDIRKILAFASYNNIPVTMRAAGTSLAGQVVGSGIIVDVSRYMKRILEINEEEKWVRVEPGVVPDELNMVLKEKGLFFGPETSTSNRCNIGGMVGNNACGSHSLIYGSTREHTIELKTILSDGSEAIFGPLDSESFERKCLLSGLEGRLYREIRQMLSDQTNREQILKGFPDPRIPRRNTGYALDMLLDSEVFTRDSGRPFNFCNLLAGSEGTLAIVTEVRLNLVSLPPPHNALVCIHLRERNDAFHTNLKVLKYNPSAVEMMDNRILELTKNNISQRNNRFFLEGEPGSVVIAEFEGKTSDEVDSVISEMIDDLKRNNSGYAYPVIKGKDISRVWALRKAGLGILSNMKGDSRPVSLIEDTAVYVEHLPQYIEDFEEMLARYNKDVVYHAHIGTGELHIRPVLNLKDPDDVELFRILGTETAKLVKKYRGSMSGEHGDGRLRGEFIPLVMGEHNYNLMKEIKKTWDPGNLLNPGKITDTPVMNTSLRYVPGKKTPEITTILDFSSTGGIVRAAEKCNGSGDCRKTVLIGGTMCPSFMATGEEKDSTRARANILREFLGSDESNPWDHREIYDILKLCLSCKGCKAECPSGVDIAKLKAEFLQHWHDIHGIPLRTLLIAYITTINRIGSIAPQVFNFFIMNKLISGLFKRTVGIARQRSIPSIYKTTLRKWAGNNLNAFNPKEPVGKVCLFIDEFSNFNDTAIGISTVTLLTKLGYRVVTVKHNESARTYLSKGLLRKAKKIVRDNITRLREVVNGDVPLIGIEPSAILGFRDEYPDLAGDDIRDDTARIARSSFMVDEFVAGEYRAGRIRKELFAGDKSEILLHAHCQQKAVSSSSFTIEMLSIPENYNVREIPSGCCGMAGSFGYEKEHYDLAVRIGEMILFPEIRSAARNVIIVAPGTSCRHHIKDGTGRTALHPAEVLLKALKSNSG
jgi:FAD/FMN-containing dehydrogenase/Fe-S oxidoreductase